MGKVLVTRPLVEGGTDPLLLAGYEILAPEDPPDEGRLAELAHECDGIVSHLTDRIRDASAHIRPSRKTSSRCQCGGGLRQHRCGSGSFPRHRRV